MATRSPIRRAAPGRPAVMQLRDVLTRAGLDLPIHIFGALDPLFVPLYFAAGADVAVW